MTNWRKLGEEQQKDHVPGVIDLCRKTQSVKCSEVMTKCVHVWEKHDNGLKISEGCKHEEGRGIITGPLYSTGDSELADSISGSRQWWYNVE